MNNFETNEEVERILNKSKDREKSVAAVEYVFALMQEKNLKIQDYRWQMLVNHIAGMVDRSQKSENLCAIDTSIFHEISEDSITLAEQVVDFIGNLNEDEKYLLSVHFDSSKFI